MQVLILNICLSCFSSVLTLEQARALCTTTFDLIKAELSESHLAAIESRRQGLLNTVSQTNYEQQTLNIR